MGFASRVDAVVRREPERDLSGCHAATWILAADGEHPRRRTQFVFWSAYPLLETAADTMPDDAAYPQVGRRKQSPVRRMYLVRGLFGIQAKLRRSRGLDRRY